MERLPVCDEEKDYYLGPKRIVQCTIIVQASILDIYSFTQNKDSILAIIFLSKNASCV